MSEKNFKYLIKDWFLNYKFLTITLIMFFFHPFFAGFIMLPICFILLFDSNIRKKTATQKQKVVQQFENDKEIELTFIKGIDSFEHGKKSILKINPDKTFSVIQDKNVLTKKNDAIYYLRFFDYKLKPENDNYEAEKDKEYVIFRMRDTKEFMFRLDNNFTHFVLSKFIEESGIKEDSGVISV